MSISLKASTAFRISQEDSSFASTSESCCCWACIADPSPSLNLLLGTLLRLPYACNERGRLALSFLRRQSLCSVSSFFQQKNKTTHTYVHHGSQTQSPDLRQTDFVLTPFSELKRVQQCVFHDGLVSSDHRGIITTLKVIPTIPKKRSLKPRTIRRNWVQLRDNGQIRE